MNTIAERLGGELRPLYEKLIEKVKGRENITFFCGQWGKNYPDSPNNGILFVGRSVNGWTLGQTKDINVMFGKGEKALFNNINQMQWVEETVGDDGPYNTNRSALWRVIKRVVISIYKGKSVSQFQEMEGWSSYAAWSNVCKVAPIGGGNPSEALWEDQLDVCLEIFEKEIVALSPRFVVFLTRSDWSDPFICQINGGNMPKSMGDKRWGKYRCMIYEINKMVCICSEHPQCKEETSHVDCIVDIINGYSKKAG